jgi:hypothetical protein
MHEAVPPLPPTSSRLYVFNHKDSFNFSSRVIKQVTQSSNFLHTSPLCQSCAEFVMYDVL